MADDWVETTAGDLDSWAKQHGDGIDVYGLRLLLELAGAEPEITGPGELTPARLRRLLLETFPEAVVAEAEDVPTVLTTVGALVDFLAATGRIDAGRAAALHAELVGLAPELVKVITELDEAERESAGELVRDMMLADGVDLDDETAVARWLAEFESLGEEERFERAAAHLREHEDMTVPPVVLAPVPELAAAARRSGLGGLPEDDDETVLAAWLRLFDEAVSGGAAGGDDVERLVRDELTGVLIHLYEQDEPTVRDDLAAALAGHLLDTVADHGVTPPPADVAAALGRELDTLESWGVAGTAPDGSGGVVLTPLGVWAVRELLLAEGFVAPVVGELAGVPAAALVEGLAWHGEEAFEAEAGLWLAARPAEDAVAELIEVMRAGGPAERTVAAAVLGGADDAAAPALRAALDHPAVRPYARMWLYETGAETAEPDMADLVWMLLDTAAALLDSVGPADAVREVLADVPEDADMRTLIDGMADLGHPQAAEVLDALAAHLPDPEAAEAARAEALRARSR